MGKEVGINLIKQLKTIEYIVVDEQGKIDVSDNIKLNSIEKLNTTGK